MKTSTKWAIGLTAVVVLGGVLLASGTATAAAPPTGMKDSGVRHGIRYEGCDHFDVADPAAIEAWARDNALSFAKYLLKIDEIRANPEPAIVEALQKIFPECPWPPPPTTTFGADKKSWSEAMVAATEAAANFDLASAGNAAVRSAATPPSGLLISRILSFGVRARPMVPRG